MKPLHGLMNFDKSGMVWFPLKTNYMTYYPDDKRFLTIAVGSDPVMIPNRRQLQNRCRPSGPDKEIFFDRGEAFDPENRSSSACRRYRKRPLHQSGVVCHNLTWPCCSRSEVQEFTTQNWYGCAGLRLVCDYQGPRLTLKQTSCRSSVKLKRWNLWSR